MVRNWSDLVKQSKAEAACKTVPLEMYKTEAFKEQLAKYLQFAAPCIQKGTQALQIALPHVIRLIEKAREVYRVTAHKLTPHR